MSNTYPESHNQENNAHQSKNIYSLNNEKTKEQIISQYKEYNTIELDENMLNHRNERISYKVIDYELESNNNNEPDRRSRAHNEIRFTQARIQKKQKAYYQMSFKTKHDKKYRQ